MNDELTTISTADFKNRKTGLMLFGIVQIIMGAMSLISFIFTIFALLLSSSINQSTQAEINPLQLLLSLFFYIMIAVILIWLGLGSIGAKRWARALTLILSWFWLITGFVVVIVLIYLMNGGLNNLLQSGQSVDPAIFKVVMVVMIFVMSLFMILLPIGFILFYNSNNVKKTVEHFDPKIRWTDKCPLPVLAASLMFGYSAVISVFNGIYGWVVPFMGFIFFGWIGALILLLNALIYAYLAFQFYNLERKSWILAIGFNVFWIISLSITFSRNSIYDMYEKMNFNEIQLEQIKSMGLFENFIYLMVIIFVAYIGYIIYIKRYFFADKTKS